MAVDDFLSRDTDAFVLPSKSFYPTKIPIAHYQLRHFISSPEQDLIYYASGNDIYCLNAATHTQSHLATLPFEARCTASGFGYVCVGGADDGNFAAIKVAGVPVENGYSPDTSLPARQETGPPRNRHNTDTSMPVDAMHFESGPPANAYNTDTPLPVDGMRFESAHPANTHNMDMLSPFDILRFEIGHPPAHNPNTSVPVDLMRRESARPHVGTAHRIRLEKIGQDIVNSISIHKLPAATSEGRDDVVAVLTNNDKSVRVYSLVDNIELCCIDLPIAMNHATISPDGKFLVAVGDQQTGFFFERYLPGPERPSTWKEPSDRLNSVPPVWKLFEEVALYVPSSQCAEGYFTTAWSPSGRLCAVGSECGYITVFDVDHLKVAEYGEDAILQVISSTRPDVCTSAGAVRTMQFSPAPWDFLIWSEDQGRVCVADLRSGLKVKQVLTLDPRDEDLDTIEIGSFETSLAPEMSELRREADFIRRYRRTLDSEGTQAAVNAANEYFEADLERQSALRRLGVVESDNDPHGLSFEERRILETLRTSRHALEGRQPGVRPRSINYTTAGHVEAARERAAAARDMPSDLLDDLLSESLRPTNRSQGERTAPRRQASVVVSINEGTVNVPPHAQTNITDSATTRSPNTILAHTRSEIINSTDDAWRTIEAALASQARAANNTARTSAWIPAASSNNPTAPELRNELRRIRQLTQMRERLRNARASQPATEAYDFSLNFRRASRTTHDPGQGVRTAGLAMSQDGRTLYCGTEEGIFEFKMNLHARKGFPAISPR